MIKMKRREFVLLRYSVFFTLLYILVGCTENRVQMQRLQVIDSLMEAHPQAAYDSLCRFDSLEVPDASRKVAMKCRMLMAKAQNKLYLQLSADTKFQEVVDYYDSWGTDNEKMQAYYLMGCVFRDQKDAPKAMMSYKKAIECADTLRKECDYKVLFGIYGQMADIYRYQYLHKQSIECYKKYSYYAAKANNMASYIQGFELIASEYYALGDTLKAVEQIKKGYWQYKAHGMRQDAAQMLPTLIYVCLQRAQYQQAHYYMDIYEKESGLFDKNNNILTGREHYYKAKGMYFLGINRIDSAEYYYRKLGRYGFRYETAQGLLSVYRKHLNGDSIRKYSISCEQEMDKILNSTQADAVIQANSLYDYKRLQKQMSDMVIQEEKNKNVLLLMGFIALFFSIYVYNKYKNNLRKKEIRLAKLNKEYLQAVDNAQNTIADYMELKKNTTLFEQKMIKKINVLQDVIDQYEAKLENVKQSDRIIAIENSDIFLKFKNATTPKLKAILPNQNDWKALEILFKQYFPLVYAKISRTKLSTQEFHVCVLSWLKFDNREMSILLQTTTSSICNAKQKANYKLFDQNSASSLYKNLSMLIH
ncbi:hypothetical protein DXB41_12735 [Segatella copri]|nr:hypothetical protein DXB41_12735 [Segatella copri]